MILDDKYVAGLFDGEGWFQIDRTRPKDTKRGISYQVHARICMRDSELIYQLQKQYGGSARLSSKETNKHAAYYTWDICGENVATFALSMKGLLIVKQKQAVLALAFQTLKRENKNRACSDIRFAELTEMYDQMRHLNKKGVSR